MPLTVIERDSSNELFTASTFLDFISLTNNQWWEGETQKYAFRGQADSAWKLIPSAFRDPPNAELLDLIDFFGKRVVELSPTTKNSVRLISIHQSHYDFARLALEAGLIGRIKVQNRYPKNCINIECVDGYDYFFCPYELDPNVFSDGIDFLGLAQHHGIPTHLIDWTKNPIVAAHFATKDWISTNRSSDITIWAIKLTENEFQSQLQFHNRTQEVRGAIIDTDIKLNSFAFHQKGCFSLFNHQNGLNEYFMATGHYPALEEIAATNIQDLELVKIILRSSEVAELRHVLNRLGILDHLLMPTFDKVAETAKLLWKGRCRSDR